MQMGPASASSGENDQQKVRKPQSLLVQALAVPSLNGSKPPPQQTVRPAPVRHQSSSDSLHGLPEPFIPVHSDFTIPTSNLSFSDYEEDVPDQLSSTKRRSVFGQGVSHKYRITRVESSDTLPVDHRSIEEPPMVASTVPRHYNDRTISDLTPPSSPSVVIRNVISPLTPYCENPTSSSSSSTNKRRIKAHETIHAQSLLLGFAFMAIWSPQNGMAPNLTEIAEEFGFNSAERDFYLGSILSLAAGVLSFPMSAGIGIMTDMYSRKHLFVLTVAMGGLSSWATGASRTYRCLFWARLLNGGCMSGSVPIAFSLLSDLFQSSERNAASSGLSAMMGVGIVAGQVYAGVVGSTLGWPHIFYVSAIWTLASAFLVWLFVQEPVRGGKEKVLQDMLESGTHYDRKLSWKGFLHAIWYNKSNSILMWQGFFSSVPWGIIFVFLNDYLSQERGFSVPDATYLVFMFGLGCAAGGVLGGYWGQLFIDWNRSYLPLFMAATTFLGIFPFIGLLNGSFTNAHGVEAVFFSIMGGLIASLPSVNVRPCIINVNPPETRGAALTAANLIINLARGAGPSCITLMGAIWHVNRKFSFNVTLAFFWVVSALQLLFLARTLPEDQDAMEAELAQYAESRMQESRLDEDDSIVSIEDRITSFDVGAARESIQFMGEAFREIGDEIRFIRPLHAPCQPKEGSSSEEDEEDASMTQADLERRRTIWIERQASQRRDGGRSTQNENMAPDHLSVSGRFPVNETTPLL